MGYLCWGFGSAYVGTRYGESCVGYMYARAVWSEGERFLICDLSKSGDDTSKAV